MNLTAYWRLARLHQPIGSLLLWYPTAWALWLASGNHPSWILVGLFILGTITMRSAGCIMNDMADRQFDFRVQRTQSRPLTSGQVTLIEAFILLGLFLAIALAVLLQLPRNCFVYSLFALLISAVYPFCKRFIRCPQLILGLAFSMGIPIAYCATVGVLTQTTGYLCLINFLWILCYDTEYALADKRDDLKIGINSTAIFFGDYVLYVLGFLHIIMQLLWLYLLPHTKGVLIGWLFASLILIYQHRLLAADAEFFAIQAFRSNNLYGLLMWLGIVFM